MLLSGFNGNYKTSKNDWNKLFRINMKLQYNNYRCWIHWKNISIILREIKCSPRRLHSTAPSKTNQGKCSLSDEQEENNQVLYIDPDMLKTRTNTLLARSNQNTDQETKIPTYGQLGYLNSRSKNQKKTYEKLNSDFLSQHCIFPDFPYKNVNVLYLIWNKWIIYVSSIIQ